MSTATDSKRIRKTKRILSVTIRRMVDDSPDTSHLGEYSRQPANEFAIDRAHAEDCASLEANHRDAVDKLERIIAYIDSLSEDGTSATDDLVELQQELTECDCSGGDMGRNELRYFNPSFNYVTKNGQPADGLTAEDVRKYTRQDYERMERANRGDWCYLGIRADAEVVVHGNESGGRFKAGSVVQRITSGGLWGIESDSDRSYFDEVQRDELASLKDELLALGFSKRAIATAFKDVQEKEE